MRIALIALPLALLVSACDETAMTATSPAVTAAAFDPATIYGAREDQGIALPALPVTEIPAEFQRQVVAYDTDQPANTVIINPAEKHLYLVLGNGRALRYGIAVGRSGFLWSGEAVIANRRTWPTWTPPPEMIARRPDLAQFKNGQPGGPTNPLGARALYLETNGVDYGYRIHGTPEWESIGHNASSGCIRMINQDVMDLYDRVPDGAKVIVMTADGQMPTRLSIPPVVKPAKPKAQTPPPPPPPVVSGPI